MSDYAIHCSECNPKHSYFCRKCKIFGLSKLYLYSDDDPFYLNHKSCAVGGHIEIHQKAYCPEVYYVCTSIGFGVYDENSTIYIG